MSKETDSAQGNAKPKLEPSGPWKKFWVLVTEPWTLLLLAASVALFVIGQQRLSSSVTALIQILLAVASGVLGARVTNLLETASGKSILEARGKVAVRGLKLMLVQTTAFQVRIQRFLTNREHIEKHPEVTVRNYEEAIEFCRRIQEEAASAMETWGDVVPAADLSSLIGRITEAEEQRDAIMRDLEQAKADAGTAVADSQDAHRMREKIKLLERQVSKSEDRIRSLTRALDATSPISASGLSALDALRGAVSGQLHDIEAARRTSDAIAAREMLENALKDPSRRP